MTNIQEIIRKAGVKPRATEFCGGFIAVGDCASRLASREGSVPLYTTESVALIVRAALEEAANISPNGLDISASDMPHQV